MSLLVIVPDIVEHESSYRNFNYCSNPDDSYHLDCELIPANSIQHISSNVYWSYGATECESPIYETKSMTQITFDRGFGEETIYTFSSKEAITSQLDENIKGENADVSAFTTTKLAMANSEKRKQLQKLKDEISKCEEFLNNSPITKLFNS